MRKHLFYTVLFMPQNFEAKQEPMNKQTSIFFDKKKRFPSSKTRMKIFIQLGKFSSLYSSRLSWNLSNKHCPGYR